MSYLLFLAVTAAGMFAAVTWPDLVRVPETLADYLENRK
jgi:hypothetical protein